MMWGAISLLAMIGMACSDDDKIPEPPVDHRVLVYLVADNNLSDSADESVERIVTAYAAIEPTADLYVFLDNYTGGPVLYKIEPSGVKTIMTQMAENNSVAGSFIRQICLSVFKDDGRVSPENTLVFWSHGTSWFPKKYASELKSFGYDEGQQIDLPELRESLEGVGVNNLLFDACLMGSVEVAAELSAVADYMVASPAEILTYSFPYEDMIPRLCQDKPDLKGAVDVFYDYYQSLSGSSRSATLSLYDLSRVRDLGVTYGTLVRQAYGSLWDQETPTIHYDRYSRTFCYDMYNAATLAHEKLVSLGSETADKLFWDFEEAFRDFVLYERHTDYMIGMPIRETSGLAVFVPTLETSYLRGYYEGLQWYSMISK